MPETILPVGLLIVRSYPGVGTFDVIIFQCKTEWGLGTRLHLTLTDGSLVSIQKRLPSMSVKAFGRSRCWGKV